MDDALGEFEWIKAMWAEAADPTAEMSELTRRHGSSESVVVIRQLGSEVPSFSAIDARGLCDHLVRPSGSTGASADRRTKVDIGVVCDSLQAVHGTV